MIKSMLTLFACISILHGASYGMESKTLEQKHDELVEFVGVTKEIFEQSIKELHSTALGASMASSFKYSNLLQKFTTHYLSCENLFHGPGTSHNKEITQILALVQEQHTIANEGIATAEALLNEKAHAEFIQNKIAIEAILKEHNIPFAATPKAEENTAKAGDYTIIQIKKAQSRLFRSQIEEIRKTQYAEQKAEKFFGYFSLGSAFAAALKKFGYLPFDKISAKGFMWLSAVSGASCFFWVCCKTHHKTTADKKEELYSTNKHYDEISHEQAIRYLEGKI